MLDDMSILPAAGLTSRLYTLGGTSTLMHATPYKVSERHTLWVDMRCLSLHRKMQRTQASRSNRTTL